MSCWFKKKSILRELLYYNILQYLSRSRTTLHSPELYRARAHVILRITENPMDPLTGSGNCTLPYELPVRVNLLYEISGMRSYALFCAILIPSSTLLTIGATGADTAMVSLTFYLCGQLSVLDHRMGNIDLQSPKYHHEMKVLVKRHAELLR